MIEDIKLIINVDKVKVRKILHEIEYCCDDDEPATGIINVVCRYLEMINDTIKVGGFLISEDVAVDEPDVMLVTISVNEDILYLGTLENAILASFVE